MHQTCGLYKCECSCSNHACSRTEHKGWVGVDSCDEVIDCVVHQRCIDSQENEHVVQNNLNLMSTHC